MVATLLGTISANLAVHFFRDSSALSVNIARLLTSTLSGFCYSAAEQTYYRESCTDPTWQDPACIKLFTNHSGDIPITKCEGGRWYYGTGSAATACCDGGLGVWVTAHGTQVDSDPNVAISTPVAAAPTDNAPSDRGEHRSLALRLGCGLGIPSLMLVVLFLIFRRCRSRCRYAVQGKRVAKDEHKPDDTRAPNGDLEDFVLPAKACNQHGADMSNIYKGTEISGNASVLLGNRYDSGSRYYIQKATFLAGPAQRLVVRG